VTTFEAQVQAALDELPASIAKALTNVAVVVEDEDPDDPDVFGLWEADEYMPDKITIFRRPLERAFPDRNSSRRRSGSPCCTSSRTTSESRRTGSTSSATRSWKYVAALSGGNTGKVSPWWLISAYAVLSVGELMLSPMGLSLVSKVAPERMRGMMMAAGSSPPPSATS